MKYEVTVNATSTVSSSRRARLPDCLGKSATVCDAVVNIRGAISEHVAQ